VVPKLGGVLRFTLNADRGEHRLDLSFFGVIGWELGVPQKVPKRIGRKGTIGLGFLINRLIEQHALFFDLR
jgi:hypothetical protein